MSISGILGDLVAAPKNLVSNFIDIGGHPYDTDVAGKVTNTNVSENDRSWQSSLGYAFKVVRVNNGKIVPDSPLFPWGEFVFQINPQDISQDEIFAIQVTPTFSGVMVEHQSVTLKDIVISGTTGISPNRAAGGALPRNGRPAFASGRSGYYEFQELRSYIRSYAEAKRNDKDKSMGELRLVWRNFKDKEDLFVEPQKFTMKRSSTKPMSYDYSIQLKAIGIAEKLGKDDGWLEVVGALDEIITYIQDTIDTAVKVLQGGIGFLEKVERDVSYTVLGPARSAGVFLQEYVNAGKRLELVKNKIHRASFEKAFLATATVYDNGADYLNRNVTEYNEIKGRLSTSSSSSSSSSLSLTSSYTENKTMNALRKLMTAFSHIIRTNDFFENSIQSEADAITSVYSQAKLASLKSANSTERDAINKEIEQKKLSADVKGLKSAQDRLAALNQSETQRSGSRSSIQMTDARYTTTVVISKGDNVHSLAARYMGDPDKYRDIILINNLSSPYIKDTVESISDPRVKGVLRLGDKIFIPLSGAPTISTQVSESVEYPINVDLDEIEKSYGIDIKLDKNFDIELDPTGDVKLVSSKQNVGQALLLKLFYEIGSLKRHPGIGTSLSIGEKSPNIKLVLSQIRQTLSADSRVDSVLHSSLYQENNAILIDLVLRLVGSDQPVRFPIKLQE